MSAPAVVGVDRPMLRIRGTAYPVLLPTLRDPRLHLAAVIVSLQVLGQVAFEFRLSIAQILVALFTSAVLEVGLAFRRQRVIMWPASALLTGNGVAFVLRVPGTEHGDWWSMHGWWIFAATAAVALLSKYVIRFRGGHVFNPSNIGLVLCFLALGPERADPLPFWWGPMSPALALALAIIVAGGFAILGRLHLVEIAVGFWLAFAAGIGLLAASGHEMTAYWHVGPIDGAEFWWVLVTSPEILVFLFFMITDPRTVPRGRAGRRAYAIGIGMLATLLIAPQTTEFATKVAVLVALALVCTSRPLLELLRSARPSSWTTRLVGDTGLRAGAPRRLTVVAIALVGAAIYGGLVVAAGVPARPGTDSASAAPTDTAALPDVTVVESPGVAQIDRGAAMTIARDVVADLRSEADALRLRDLDRAAAGASGAWLAALWKQIRDGAGRPVAVPMYDVERMQVRLKPGDGQGPPTVVALLEGTATVTGYGETPSTVTHRSDPERFRRTVELALERGRYRIVRSQGGVATIANAPSTGPVGGQVLGGVSLEDVAAHVGLSFRHGAFRFGMSNDTTAMMGGGVCWLDYDSDGWLDLFVVNSYAQTDILDWEAKGGLPRSALFRNVGGRFEDVSRHSGADLPLRGNGCVAADFNLDGSTDLYVTSAGYNVPTDGYDALLWNDGDGSFTEGAREAGIKGIGWHAGAAVGDVNGDRLPDLFVAGYTDPNLPVASSSSGFPTNHHAVRDLLYLNQGAGKNGRSTFREVGRLVGIEDKRIGHGLGAVLVDYDLDGRLDLYVANDADPNQLYRNIPHSGSVGFRFAEIAKREAIDDPNAGMGIAAADFSHDGRTDLFVTNSRGQLHAAYLSRRSGTRPSFADVRPDLAAVLGTRSTGWGASWVDVDLDGDLDLVVANGAIPIVDLVENAQRVRVVENVAREPGTAQFAPADAAAGLGRTRRVNGRGLAAADFDNDGDVDLAINSIGGRLMLLRNDASAKRGHWLEVRLGAFAPGAVVTVVLADGRRLVRHILAGSSYLSSEDPRVHFGLGSATKVKELRVRFPGGSETRRTGLAVDRVVVVGSPAG
ncbi:MAG TPA: FG-GAP-like repeat-containing protein [Gaiellaceae bacterium]|nr:FG-GAP-like repeat-containing protein [Gaiellaceae bacterium]